MTSMTIEQEIRQKHMDSMNPAYIARLMNLPLKVVDSVLSGDHYIAIAYTGSPRTAIKVRRPKADARSDKQRQYVERLKIEASKREAARINSSLAKVPAEYEEIIRLSLIGLSVRKIHRRIRHPSSERQLARIVARYLGAVVKTNHSYDNQISASMMPYVLEALERLGKDRYICERCREHQSTPCIVHHTTYTNPTIYDLQFACASCNVARAGHGIK